MDPVEDKQKLGQSGLMVSSVGLGTWAWGDRIFWGFGNEYSFKEISDAFDVFLSSGGNFIDTAEIYGQGKSERIIGELIKSKKSDIVLASKFMPFPWRLRSTALFRSLKQSLSRLSVESIDLYQIHFPLPPTPVETWCSALSECVQKGLIKTVGVSNFNINQLVRAFKTLVKSDIFLASNQVEYHLLNRSIEKNGLFSLCKEMGISIIAYSPLAQGLLTGKYTPENGLKGVRSFRYPQKLLVETQPLIRLMLDIGRNHDGKSPAQVALNWIICKGAIPIPGAKNGQQSLQNAGAMGWRLTAEEIDLLDKMSDKINQDR
jgi:aryl-alcohol dehydrogenase-like predicted oxidoreductase